MRIVLVFLIGVTGCLQTEWDPCPGKLTCASMVCCPAGFPYHCGTQCYERPPLPSQCAQPIEVCEGGGGGGTLAMWNGSYHGPCTSMNPGLPSQTMNVTFTVSNGTITSGAPGGGSVTASGFMSVTVIDRLGTPFAVSGQISLTSTFTIHGTTPNLEDGTSITCSLSRR